MPHPESESMKSAGNGKTAAARDGGGTILYVDCRPDAGIEGRRLDGMRRYIRGKITVRSHGTR